MISTMIHIPKHTFIAIAILLFCTYHATGQTLVFDPAVVSTLVINHTAQQEVLKDIKDNEGKIAGYQLAITAQMEKIREIKDKMYTSLKTVQGVVQNAKDIVYASQVARDIGKYQKEMMDLAGEEPALTVVAAKTELALVNRTADLFLYIYSIAMVGGDINLMDNAERLKIIRHVIDELRVMRGLAYSVVRRMRVARRAGIIRTLNPLGIYYPNNGAAIAKSLIDEIKRK